MSYRSVGECPSDIFYDTGRLPDHSVCAAFATGEREAVRGLYAWVCYYTGMYHIPQAIVKRQMEKEFPGISLDDVPLDWISYKDSDMQEPDVRMLERMQMLLRNDGK